MTEWMIRCPSDEQEVPMVDKAPTSVEIVDEYLWLGPANQCHPDPDPSFKDIDVPNRYQNTEVQYQIEEDQYQIEEEYPVEEQYQNPELQYQEQANQYIEQKQQSFLEIADPFPEQEAQFDVVQEQFQASQQMFQPDDQLSQLSQPIFQPQQQYELLKHLQMQQQQQQQQPYLLQKQQLLQQQLQLRSPQPLYHSEMQAYDQGPSQGQLEDQIKQQQQQQILLFQQQQAEQQQLLVAAQRQDIQQRQSRKRRLPMLETDSEALQGRTHPKQEHVSPLPQESIQLPQPSSQESPRILQPALLLSQLSPHGMLQEEILRQLQSQQTQLQQESPQQSQAQHEQDLLQQEPSRLPELQQDSPQQLQLQQPLEALQPQQGTSQQLQIKTESPQHPQSEQGPSNPKESSPQPAVQLPEIVRSQKGRREKIPEGTLCVVCSDVASGIHYSVASCNGCKTFFRRAVVNKQTFQCQFRNDCIVDKSVRCGCRSCRLKKCFHMGMDPNAIQHDRDKIRYTKRAKKSKDEEEMDLEIGANNPIYLKEEAESPQSAQTPDEPGNISSPSSSGLQVAANIGAAQAVNGDGTQDGVNLNGGIFGVDMPQPPPSIEIRNMKADVNELVAELLALERKVMEVRCGNSFPPHNTVASCVFDRKLLEDEEWLLKYQEHDCTYEPQPCDRDTMRRWFCKDLTLMIEWAKCLPGADKLGLLLNDKLALVKAMAPVYPLIQLALFSCSHDARLKNGLVPSKERICGLGPIGRLQGSLDANGGYGAGMPGLSNEYDGLFIERLWYPDGRFLTREEMPADPLLFVKLFLKKIPPVNALLLDSVCNQFLKYGINERHIVLYKQMLFYNPDADGLSSRAKEVVIAERTKTLNRLYWLLSRDRNPVQTNEAYSAMLLVSCTLARVASYLKRTFDITHIFGPSNDLIDQLIIIGL